MRQVNKNVPVSPARKSEAVKECEEKRKEDEGYKAQQRHSRRLVWIDVVASGFSVVNYISRVPPVFVDLKRVVVDNRPHLVESSSLIVVGGLIKISVGSPQQS